MTQESSSSIVNAISSNRQKEYENQIQELKKQVK